MNARPVVHRILKPIRGLGKAVRYFRRSAGALTVTALALTLAAPPVFANPEGPQVRHGQAHYSPGVDAQIQQLTDKAIIDWQSFSIGQRESLRILQPSELSIILNRVVGGDPSQILGSLSANGNVFLINPAGIVFGPASVVNVGGLVASTLGISDEDFLAGRYTFLQDNSGQLTAVVNQGKITINKAGFAVLTGPAVVNEGSIVAQLGKVVLAAGEKTTLNLDGRDLVHYAISNQVSPGAVILAPGMTGDILADAMGISAEQRADRLVTMPDGSIRLASSSGTLVQAGSINVDGKGGNDAGLIVLESTDLTVLTDTSRTSANAEQGDGGTILVLSGMDPDLVGKSEVRAGAELSVTGKNGGFIEVSGDQVQLEGKMDFAASDGVAGHFLLDPDQLIIIDGNQGATPDGNGNTILGKEWIRAQNMASLTLESTGDLIFDLATKGDGATNDGVVNFRSFAASGTDRAVTLRAGTSPAIVGSIDFGDDGTVFRGVSDLVLEADGDIDFGDGEFVISRSLTATAGREVNFGESDIQISSTSTTPFTITAQGDINLESSNINIGYRAFSTTDADASIISNGGSINLGDADIRAVNESTTSSGVNLTIQASGDIIGASSDDNPATFANVWRLGGDIALISQTGDILLADLDLEVKNSSDIHNIVLNAAGDIVVAGEILNYGSVTFDGTNSIVLDSLALDLWDGGNLTVLSDGDISISSSQINANVTPGQTGGVSITSGGAVDLSDTSIKVSGPTTTPLTIQAQGDIDLDGADINIGYRSFSTIDADASIISNGGSINLGDADIRAVNESTTASGVNLTMRAGDSITSDEADGDPTTFVNVFTIDGTISLTSQTGDILLYDVEFLNTRSSSSADFLLSTGRDLALGGRLAFSDAFNVQAPGSVTLDDLILDVANGDISVTAGDFVSIQRSQINTNLGTGQTGGVSITSGDSVNLTDTSIRVSSSTTTPLTIQAEGDIDLDGADINIGYRSFSTTDADVSVISNGGSINLGDADIRAVNESTTASGVNVTLRAGDSVTSAEADGDPTTFVNVFLLDGTLSLTSQTGDILLHDVELRNTRSSSSSDFLVDTGRDLAIGGRFAFSDPFSIQAPGSITLDDLVLDVANSDISVIAGDFVSMQRSQINTHLGTGQTGGVSITSGDSVNLTDTSIRVSSSTTTPLTIQAEGDIDLDSSTIDIGYRSFSTTDANVSIISNNGNVSLGDAQLSARNEVTSASGVNLAIGSVHENVFLEEANLSGDTTLTVTSGGTLHLGSALLDAPDGVILAAGRGVDSTNARLTTGDVAVHGLSSGVPDPSQAVAGNVNLNIVTPNNSDLSVFARDDITVNHTGPGALTLERMGVEGPGGAGSPAALRSLQGDISLSSDRAITIGKGSTSNDGDTALISAEGTQSRVFLSAPDLIDNNDGVTTKVTDIAAGGEIELRSGGQIGRRTGKGGLELQAPDIILDAASTPGSEVSAEVLAGNGYLEVRGNGSDVQVLDIITGGVLRVSQLSGQSVLSLGDFQTANILYVDSAGVALSSVVVGAGERLGIQALSGDITSVAGSSINLVGELVLVASGDVGQRSAPILVSGGEVAGQAGGEFLLESDGQNLTVGEVSIVNRLGQSRLGRDGISSGGDTKISMTNTGGGRLNLEADITSASGIALDLESADVVQTAGKNLTANVVALEVGGNAGRFTPEDGAEEISIQASQVVIDVLGDALVSRSSGDLQVVEQTTIAGTTYTTSGAGEDLRVRAQNGSLRISSDLSAGGDAALVSGSRLEAGRAQTVPGSVVLDGNVTAGGNLVVVSSGSITQTNGLLSAPSVGLGAGTTLGSTTQPINVATNNAAITSGGTPNVVDANGYTTVPQVTAVGTTVNGQIAPVPPTPPTPNPPTPPQEVTTSSYPNDIFPGIADQYPLSQDRIEHTERDQQENREQLDQSLSGQDQVDPPRSWWGDDEDFLRHKSRKKSSL